MKNRILSLIMTAVTTASFMVSPCTHAFNIERECGEVVVTIIDEETNKLFKEHIKSGMTMNDDKLDASESKEYTFDDILSMTTAEIEALYESNGMTWEKGYHVYKPEIVLSNGFYLVQLDPKPFMTARNGEELLTEVYSADDMHELIEDGDVIWDIGKIYSALELSPALFDIHPSVSMPRLMGTEETGPIYRKYCNCVIKPYASDNETAVSLYTAMLNYVQLKSCCEGIHFEGMGGGMTTFYTSLKGDVNCDNEVDMADAVMIMQALANPDKYGLNGTADHHLTEQGKLNGDMNGDGLTVGDAQAIQKKLLGLDEPAEIPVVSQDAGFGQTWNRKPFYSELYTLLSQNTDENTVIAVSPQFKNDDDYRYITTMRNSII